MEDKLKNSFTLIELLVAISFFTIFIVSVLGIFNSVFLEQKKNLAQQYLLSSSSYLIEYISRALRMAQKDIAGKCIGAKSNYQVSAGESSIKFLNDKGKCQRFYLGGDSLFVEKDGLSLPLSPSNIKVENLKFIIAGENQNDKIQPKVTIGVKLTYQNQKLPIQTTISQRQLDVVY